MHRRELRNTADVPPTVARGRFRLECHRRTLQAAGGGVVSLEEMCPAVGS
jgi:hypothetical protein